MRAKILSFIAGFGLVLCVAGVKHYAPSAVIEDGHSAMANPGHYQAIIDVPASQKRYLMTALGAQPDHMLKVMGKDVQAVFRDPELVRQDHPTVIWQYRSRSCVLDVYFTATDEDPLFSPVVHYEFRQRDAKAWHKDIASGREIETACMREMLGERVTASNEPPLSKNSAKI